MRRLISSGSRFEAEAGYSRAVVDEQAHELWIVWWNRIIPYRSYVKGWKISPSHYLNQDLATVWLDK